MSDRDDNCEGALDQSVDELNDLVARLLFGWRDPKTGEHRYFKFGGREEHAARYAIAYLLRNHATRYLREYREFQTFSHLARLFDPNSTHELDIRFRFRREGIPDQHRKQRRIALEMLRMVRAGKSVEEAVAATMDRHGLGVRWVRKIWARYGKPMQ
jgi:hypothetical protein